MLNDEVRGGGCRASYFCLDASLVGIGYSGRKTGKDGFPSDRESILQTSEVKGRADVGVVALSENEDRTAERLKSDYRLYGVFNCAGKPCYTQFRTRQN